MQTSHYIEINQLRVGLYVHLDMSWMDHPFTRSNFRINDETQIEKIKRIGLKQIRYDPKRSDCEPLEPATIANEGNVSEVNEIKSTPEDTKESKPMSEQDKRHARLKQLQHAIDESEKQFVNMSNMIKSINKNILASPKSALEQATSLVDNLVDTALLESDIVIHAMNGNRSSDAHYEHSLNVTVLSLMMGKSLSIGKDEMQLLGISAMMHDIGKMNISQSIANKPDLSKNEQAEYQLHSAYGAQLAHKLGLPARLGRVILQHHECWDGSGYPNHLKGPQIDPLATVLYIANIYDNLCNPPRPSDAKTPYEALAYLFTQLKKKCNDELLKRFIKSLGVYPPGSIIKLSDGSYATVISVNPEQPLRPYVQLQDDGESIQPQIINLQEVSHVNITHCLKSTDLSPTLLRTLNPRKRVSYFIDQAPANE